MYFRRFRIVLWSITLLLLGALLYLNQVGLPGFIKRTVLERLRARGLDLQFSRLRLRWYEGVVAENVRFGQAAEPLSPRLTAREVRVPLNLRALLRLQVQVDGLVLRQGRLTWPLSLPTEGTSELSIDQMQTDLRFLSGDQWALDNFRAVFAGADIHLSGTVTNASRIREWTFLHGERVAPTPADVWQKRLSRIADVLEEVQFSNPPDLRMNLRGDATDLQSFSVRMSVMAPGADTPWGTVTRAHFVGRVFPAGSNDLAHAECTLEAADAQTPWGGFTNLSLGVQLRTIAGQTNLVNGVLTLSADQVRTRWVEAGNALLSASWVHDLTNPIPRLGECRVACAGATTEWGRADKFELTARLAQPPGPLASDNSWAWWTNLQPFQLGWEARLQEVESPRLIAQEIACSGNWNAPELQITNFQAHLYDGQITGQGTLNVSTRALSSSLACDVDPHQLAPLLSEDARRWLDEFGWEKPPRAKVALEMRLPVWTNHLPDWSGEVLPTVKLSGDLSFDGGGTFYGFPNVTPVTSAGVQFTNASVHILYSNLCWYAPDFKVSRSDGHLAAAYEANERTRDFYGRISSTLNLSLAGPLLAHAPKQVFDLFTFNESPVVEAQVWGNFADAARAGCQGRVALTNFTFRGEKITSLQTTFQYTNGVLQFFEPHILVGAQEARASGLTADFNAQLIFLTNGFSTAEPLIIARVIGPQIVRAIEPYQFLRPPAAHVHGAIPMRGEEGADLYFALDGGPFHWWRLTVPQIGGEIHWAGEQLSLTNLLIDFYGGKASGAASFDFKAAAGADFRFHLGMTNVQFSSLIADLAGKTNHLEGRLTGNLFVTSANTEDWHSANGHGDLNLHDALIWDIPIFGIFSPVLNGINPGLGNSRATAAVCTFVMTNGVCRTDNLEIRSSAMRLNYRGTVDLDSKVNARVEAELLRDMWLVGPLVSTVFWPVSKMFEYKVTGALGDPKMDPVFIIPRLVLFPFHPFRTLKGLLPEESTSTQTNAPPLFQELH